MRKRSKYRPREVLQDPVAYVVNGFKPLTVVTDEHFKLLAKNHAAMDEVVKGRGTKKHVDVLITAVNMAQALYMVRDGLGRDWATEIRAGQDAVLSMAQRGVATGGRFLFTGPEVTAVNMALEIHEAQLSECSIAELDSAVKLAKAEIRAKRARVINGMGDKPC
jgi:hypothetical protein